MYDITDTAAVITGGTRGIGLAIARLLLSKGGKVALNGRGPTPEAEALLAAYGPDHVVILLADVSQPGQATGLISRAVETRS